MSHEILSVKLCEMDDMVSRLHSRIQISETGAPDEIRAEADELRRECLENELTVRNRLARSRARPLSALADSFADIEKIITSARGASDADADGDDATEKSLLLAEYELDFAMLAADRALLASLDAIAAQLAQQTAKEGTLK